MAEPGFEVAIRHRIGALKLDVEFRTSAPWTVLFGASGSGKSTVLRAMAGLLRPDQGRIAYKGLVLTDERLFVPAHRRGLRWAGQAARLFPTMSVRKNLEFGADSQEKVECAIAHFQLEELAPKLPHQLSGGEQQRVAVIGAALGQEMPLLLDEPFTGLDWARRDELITQLREWVGETPVVSVTHDVGEAFLLGAEVVRMAEGRVVAQGPVDEVLARERQRMGEVLGRMGSVGGSTAEEGIL